MKSRLRILLVLGSMHPSPGASWKRASYFARSWAKKGHSVEVLGTFGYTTTHNRGFSRVDNIQVLNCIPNIGLHHPILFIINLMMSFFGTLLVIAARKPSVVMISVPTGDVGMGAILASNITRTKSALDYRDEWEDYLIDFFRSFFAKQFYIIMKRLSSYLYSKCDIVVAVTSIYVDLLKARGIKKVTHISNGADISIFRPIEVRGQNDEFVVLYSGNLGGAYSMETLMKAVALVKSTCYSGLKLVIAGKGDTPALWELSKRLGIGDSIDFHNSIIQKTKLAEVIAKSNIGIIPYTDNRLWKNSLPAKFFEYCACGIPVIASTFRDSLLGRLILDNDVGLVVPPMDHERLAVAICEIIQDKNFLYTAGKRGRLLVETRFSREKFSQEFLECLNEVMES